MTAFTVTRDETVLSSDSLVIAWTRVKTADLVLSSDTVSTLVAQLSRTVTDTVLGSDSLVITWGPNTPPDPVGLTDAGVTYGTVWTQNDTLGLTDAVSVVLTPAGATNWTRTITDLAALTDMVGGVLTGPVTPPVVTSYVFRTPVRVTDGPRQVTLPNRRTDYDDGTLRGNVLMRHFRRPGQAVCVIIERDGTVREKQVPTQVELVAALFHYLGGHEYIIGQAEADMLYQAGYTIPGYVPPPTVGYGLGVYGTGVYGL